jgi:hypothetical protein
MFALPTAIYTHGPGLTSMIHSRAPTTLKSEGEVTSLSGADKREVRDNREKW